MIFIDTHTHLYDEEYFADDMDEAVQRAIDAGVTKLVFPDISSPSRDVMFSLASRFPDNIYPCIGLHPTEIKEDAEEEWAKILAYKDMLDKAGTKIWAIGEVGLDFYWSTYFAEQQKDYFRRQLQMAHDLDLPVLIHAREATGQILEILSEFKNQSLRGIMHAFTGSIETFHELQKLGDWHIGVGGVVTFKKAGIGDTVKDIPLDRIVLETDSPYLTPVPHRGKRNESCYIPLIAAKIALQKGISVEEVAKVTTATAEQLFRF